jgi:hypothetical protein
LASDLDRVFVVTEQEVRTFALKAGMKALARHLLNNLYRAVRRDEVREECRWLASCEGAVSAAHLLLRE